VVNVEKQVESTNSQVTQQRAERQKLMVLVCIGLLYSFGIAFLFVSLPNQQFTDDFFPRWYASQKLLTTGRSLYDPANAEELVKIVGWPFTEQLRYYYPAYMLFFTAPLALLPYKAARLLWTIFGVWCLWLSMGILARLLKPGLSVNRLTMLLVLMTIAVPTLQHTLNAQFNAIGVLALVLTYQALYHHKYFAAGLWAGGLLFKPQATILPLIFFLLWSALGKRRWHFWSGLAVVGGLLWLLAEILEGGWLFNFLNSLGGYVPVSSIVDKIWNPYYLVSSALLLTTFWMIIRYRRSGASTVTFTGLLAWTVCLNALIVPLFGMLHIVSIGLVFVIILSGFTDLNLFQGWLWQMTVAFFLVGLLAFILPLVFTGVSGLQITIAEFIYRSAMPMLLGLASLWLIFTSSPTRGVN
jgi:hypothetical protein